jgi:hypothetical protein
MSLIRSPRRLVNLVLLAAVAVLLATGILPWLLSEADAGAFYAMHRVAGLMLVLALLGKYAIARGSLVRRGLGAASVWIGLSAALGVVVTAGIGLTWTAGLVSFDRPLAYSALNLHVISGLILGGIVVAHALVRGERRPPLERIVDRRAVLRGLGLLAASFAFSLAFDRVALARRVTGSRHAGSFTGNAMPVTIWAFDTVPEIAIDRWRLRVRGAVASPAALTYAQLTSLNQREARVTLDCTGGWWSEQVWSGVALGDVLAAHGLAASASRIEVVSVTGHRWTFDRAEAERALLATHVGGEPISAAHGYPLRLVMEGRRGFVWVKWIDEIVAA